MAVKNKLKMSKKMMDLHSEGVVSQTLIWHFYSGINIDCICKIVILIQPTFYENKVSENLHDSPLIHHSEQWD